MADKPGGQLPQSVASPPVIVGPLGAVITRHGELGSGVPDLVAGQGGQVVQQAAEAAVGPPGRVVLV